MQNGEPMDIVDRLLGAALTARTQPEADLLADAAGEIAKLRDDLDDLLAEVRDANDSIGDLEFRLDCLEDA